MTEKDKAFEYKKKREQDAINYYIKNKTANQIAIQNIEMDHKYFPYDNLITSGGTQYAVEIKVRKNYSYAQIKSLGNQILEKQKLIGIKEQLVKDGIDIPILYFIFFRDRLTIYKLDKEESNYLWVDKLLPRNNFDKTLVWKQVAMLSENNIIETIKYK
jgi:hypothetical protein